MFGFLKRHKSDAPQGGHVIAHITAHLDPTFRRIAYEEPLETALGTRGEITGGGSLMGEDGEILHVDIEILLPRITEDLLDLIVATLERADAPKGSFLHLDDGTVLRRFGKAEVVALTLDAHNLPKEVNARYNTDDLVDSIMPLMLGKGVYKGLHLIRDKGILYFHGTDPDAMEHAIRTIADHHPLCENAVVRRRVPIADPGAD